MWTDNAMAAIDDGDGYTAPDGTYYPPQFPKAAIAGLMRVTETARPDDAPVAITVTGESRGGVAVTGWHVEMVGDVPTQVWDAVPRPTLNDAEAAAITARDMIAAAQAALAASDRTLLRCYEAGVPLPLEWAAYRGSLRAIVAGGPGPVPARPPYPEGT